MKETHQGCLSRSINQFFKLKKSLKNCLSVSKSLFDTQYKSRIPVGMRLLYCVGGEKRSVHDFQRVAGAFAKRLLDARLELCKTVIGDESKRGAGEAAAVNSHGALAV